MIRLTHRWAKNKGEAMFSSLQEKDWRRSPAHLLLLSKFRNGDSPTRYRDADYWETALGEKPASVIEQDNDAKAMREATKDIDLHRCTAAGLQLAENYLEAERTKRESAEREVLMSRP